jgi:dolichyl-phosphate-mannose--protein O-mannosyl transferase
VLNPVVPPVSAHPHTAATYSKSASASERARPKPFAIAIMFGVVALAILSFGVKNPSKMFYDEGYFVPESKVFMQGPATVNPPQEKPPLGKLMLAMGMKAAGDNSLGWRASAVVCGALTVVAVFLWSYLLLQDLQLASLAAGLALFNNFLFVMSRIGMLDAFLMIFLIWSLVAFTASFVLDVTVGLRQMECDRHISRHGSGHIRAVLHCPASACVRGTRALNLRKQGYGDWIPCSYRWLDRCSTRVL